MWQCLIESHSANDLSELCLCEIAVREVLHQVDVAGWVEVLNEFHYLNPQLLRIHHLDLLSQPLPGKNLVATDADSPANEAENRLSDMERFLRMFGASEAYEHWNFLQTIVEKAARALADWIHSTASIFSRDDERIIGQGIIAQCQHNGLNPCQESDRIKAANSIADMAYSIVGSIGRFQWDIAVTRIGQLASEMRLSTGSQSVGDSNGNADELIKWDGTRKRGLGI